MIPNLKHKVLRIACALSLLSLPALADARGAAPGQREFLAGLTLEYRAEGSPDYPAAAAYYKAAARAGSREALLALARLSAPDEPLWSGPENWRDRLIAAAGAGWPEAAYNLADALERGKIDQAPSDGAITDLYVQAASGGFGPAAMRLGQICLEGRAGWPERDESQAAMWFTVAAENHEPAAFLALGKMFYETNPPASARWLERASTPEASCLLGELYLKDRRIIEAVSAFTAAADQNYAPAHLALGLLNLDNDYGRRPSVREALRHLKIAAQADLPDGAYHLGHMFLKGQGTPRDSITAAYWLNRAAEKNHPLARAEFDKLTYNFTDGQKKRLERMITDNQVPTMQTPVQ